MNRTAAVGTLFALGLLSSAAWGQDPKAPPQAEGKKEDSVQWSVHGVLSTDFNALLSDRHSRQTMTEEGVIGEFALGGTLHLGKRLTVELRTCVGCHDFQLQSAYADYSLSDAFTVRAGRLSLPFGSLSRRTSPAHMESTSKPLPYIMGRMVRDVAFNQGILPAPIVDNGAAVLGNVWLGETVQFGYEAAAVRGLKGSGPDIDFELSREFEDNNGEPAGAARINLTAGPLTVGASAMAGHYDPDARLDYRLAGADLTLGIEGWNLRLEGVVRSTEFRDAALEIETSRRWGYVAQIDGPLSDSLRVFALHDALRVEDLYLSPTAGPFAFPVPGATDDSNTIRRGVAGVVVAVRPGVLVKTSAEFWDFTDFDDTWVFHVEMVVAF